MKLYFYKIIAKKIKPTTEIKLTFHIIFAFLSSINWNETRRNLSTDNPIIKMIVRLETDIILEIKAVEAVNRINKPYVIKSFFFIFLKY